MRLRPTIPLALVGFSFAAFAAPAPHVHPAPQAEATEAAAKPKKICRTVEASSTSRMGSGKLCKTEADWAKHDAQASNSRAVRSIKSE